MTKVDLETLGRVVAASGDSKVFCETLIPPVLSDPNLPPESIRVSIDDYSSDLIISYDRDDSAKESTNPKSHNQNPNPNPNTTRSSSQRYSSANLKANGPILGLPNKIKHVTSTRARPRPTQTSSRFFPKKKSPAVPAHEPSSPKVSCTGKVLSDRERDRCRSAHRRPSPQAIGCWSGFAAMFSCGGRGKGTGVAAVKRDDDDVRTKNIPLNKRNIPLETDGAEAPGLGGMKRFASGRRAASWGGDEGHVAVEWGRRSLDGIVPH